MIGIDGHLAFQRDTLSETHPAATRVMRDSNGLYRKEIWLYNAYASAIPAGQPCLIRYDGDEETNPFVVSGAAASGAVAVERLVVASASIAATSWGWFVYEGYCEALIEGTTDVAKDHLLRFTVQKPTGLCRDGTAAVPLVSTCAVAREAQTNATATLADVYIINKLFAIGEDVS